MYHQRPLFTLTTAILITSALFTGACDDIDESIADRSASLDAVDEDDLEVLNDNESIADETIADEDDLMNWELRALAREDELGLTRVDHGDGTFSLQLPEGLETPETRTVGGLVWRYDGQARLPWAADPLTPRLVYEADAPAPRDAATNALGSRMVDIHGRSWVVDAVDEGALADALAAYEDEVAATVGLEPVDALADDQDELEEVEEGWSLWTPAGWTRTDCDGDGNWDMFVYDADDRSLIADPATSRQAKVLLLSTPAGLCSATMVDDEWLLTAAHCVTNGSGSLYSPGTMTACTYGNYQSGATCYGANTVAVNGSWGGSGMSDDYAVVRLSGTPGVGWMAISQASNSTLQSNDSYNVGYPGDKPNCSSNFTTAVNAGVSALKGRWSAGELFGTTASRIKTRVDAGAGHSGGPFFYYPSGCCGSHYITGVVSGNHWSLTSKYNGGPKGPAIRSWVIANTP